MDGGTRARTRLCLGLPLDPGKEPPSAQLRYFASAIRRHTGIPDGQQGQTRSESRLVVNTCNWVDACQVQLNVAKGSKRCLCAHIPQPDAFVFKFLLARCGCVTFR